MQNKRKREYLRALFIQMPAYTCIQVFNGFIINTDKGELSQMDLINNPWFVLVLGMGTVFIRRN